MLCPYPTLYILLYSVVPCFMLIFPYFSVKQLDPCKKSSYKSLVVRRVLEEPFARPISQYPV